MDEPELHIVKFLDGLGAEWRARAERDRAEARRRYRAHLAAVLEARAVTDDVGALSDAILDALTVWNDISSGERCQCSCHPRLSESEFHGYGFECSCRKTREERRQAWSEFEARMDEYRASPGGRAAAAAREAERNALEAWLARQTGVVVHRGGRMAREQWWGEVDGHSFYFRERHDEWRIEPDLGPCGRFVNTWAGGDLDDDDSFTPREIEEGDVIAEGTTSVEGYGSTPLERILFIADVIRTQLRRQTCMVHTVERDDLELLLARPVAWCPACGQRLLTEGGSTPGPS